MSSCAAVFCEKSFNCLRGWYMRWNSVGCMYRCCVSCWTLPISTMHVRCWSSIWTRYVSSLYYEQHVQHHSFSRPTYYYTHAQLEREGRGDGSGNGWWMEHADVSGLLPWQTVARTVAGLSSIRNSERLNYLKKYVLYAIGRNFATKKTCLRLLWLISHFF